MSKGHGITGRRLQDLCAEGKVKAPGERVLLEALLEEEATDSDLLQGVEIDMRKAVAFRVADVGPEVPWSLKPGDVVINVSISGERIDASDKACRWVVVHYRDLVAVISGASLS
jgi:co-chaperonin GroES (HSP10)